MSAVQPEQSVFTRGEAEAARLSFLNDFLNRVLGGVPDLSRYHTILDLACGPGAWVFDVARAYPDRQVVGIDSSPLLIETANTHALVEGSALQPFPNVTFLHVLDLEGPLSPQSASFDYIHARHLSSLLRKAGWPKVLRECWRLLRPGGVLHLTEGELPITSSAAFERFSDLIALAYQRTGRSLSGGSRSIGITAALPRLLKTAGFSQVECRPVLLDFSSGANEAKSMFQNVAVAFHLIQPFLLDSGITMAPEIEVLYQQTLVEMQAEDFDGSAWLLSFQGEKPRSYRQV